MEQQPITPSTDNKKVFSKASKFLLALLVIVFVVCGALYFNLHYVVAPRINVPVRTANNYQPSVFQGIYQTPPPLPPPPPSGVPPLPTVAPIQTPTPSCPHDTIKQYGQVSEADDILIYSTECDINSDAYNNRTGVIRFYARDAAGTFNKKIFETVNTPAMGGLTYAEILDSTRHVKVHRVTNGYDVAVVDVYGNSVHNLTDQEQATSTDGMQIYSPDKKFLATENFDGSSGVGQSIGLENELDGTSKTYDFPDTSLNGAYIAGWSTDSKTLYVVGGIWEFSAPAKLWSIDAASQTIKAFSDLDGFNFPVQLDLPRGIAYLSDYGPGDMGDTPQPKNIKIYSLDLKTGTQTFVASDTGLGAFDPFIQLGNNYYYSVYASENLSQIKKLGLSSPQPSVLYQGAVNLYSFILDNNWLVVNDNGDYKLLSDDGTTMDIGKGGKDGYAVPADGTEYVSDIVGVVKTQSGD